MKPGFKPKTTRWAPIVTRSALALCAASFAATALIGCDDYGEKKALSDQSTSSAQRAAGRTEDALTTLAGAANSTNSSTAVIQAQQSLGQVRLAKANTGAIELGKMESAAGVTLARIGAMARQARTNVVLAGNYRKLDPKLTIEQVGDFAAKARGDANVAEYPVDSAKLPSLAVAQQNKAKLDGDVSTAQQAIAAATKERDDALAEAGKLSAAMESQTGADRAGSVKQIADLRAKAAVASRTIVEQTKALSRAQAEQAEADQVVSTLQTAVETLSAQGTSLNTGWQGLSAKAAEQTALAKKILDGSDGDSVKTLTKTLNEQLKEIEAKRGEIEELYTGAVADFEKAAGNAGKRVQELSTAKSAAHPGSYEIAAWDNEAAMIAVDRINLDKASAQKSLADLKSRRAAWLASALTVTEDVESVSETLGVAADGVAFNGDKQKTDLGKTITDAAAALDDVLATLEGAQLTGADLASLKPMSAVLKIVSMADYATLADLAAANKVAPEVAKKAKDMHEGVKATADAARADNVALPSLPMSLGGNPAPATQPSEATATAATADSPEVAEIRQSLRELVTKLTAADAGEAAIDEAIARVKVGDALKPLIADIRTAAVSFQKLQGAVKEKFGEEGLAALTKNDTPATDMPPPTAAKVPTAEEIEKTIAGLNIAAVDENTATISPPAGTPGPPMKLVKEDGVWKVDLTELPPGAEMMTGMIGGLIKPIAATVDAVTADVQSGKLTSVAEVKAALQEAFKKSFGGMMGGLGGPPPGETPATPGGTPATPGEPAPAPEAPK